MIARPHLWAIVVLAFIVLAVQQALQSQPISWRWFLGVGAAVGVVAFITAQFNAWGWRWPLLQGWFVRRPHLWGRWNVRIQSHWIDPATGQRRPPFEVTWTVRQTFHALHIHQDGENASGDLLVGQVIRKEDGTYQVAGIYTGQPALDEREKSPIHYGAILLDVLGLPNRPTSLRGHYWTDRNTKGWLLASSRQKLR